MIGFMGDVAIFLLLSIVIAILFGIVAMIVSAAVLEIVGMIHDRMEDRGDFDDKAK